MRIRVKLKKEQFHVADAMVKDVGQTFVAACGGSVADSKF